MTKCSLCDNPSEIETQKFNAKCPHLYLCGEHYAEWFASYASPTPEEHMDFYEQCMKQIRKRRNAKIAVEKIIKDYGMDLFLTKFCEVITEYSLEKTSAPKDYLVTLAKDLGKALENYQNRYGGDEEG